MLKLLYYLQFWPKNQQQKKLILSPQFEAKKRFKIIITRETLFQTIIFLQNPGYYLVRDPKREGRDTFWRLLNVIIAREARNEFSFLVSRQP